MLKRRVGVRINFYRDEPTRAWFLREAEALGQLDHPAIRHVYDAGVIGDLAFRIGNWIDGEGLEDAVRRGPRSIPAVLSLARDLLGALDHAHLQGMMVRRIVPGLGADRIQRPRDDHRSPVQQLYAARGPSRDDTQHADVHGARDPGRRGGESGVRRLHRRRPALLRRDRPEPAARPARAPAVRPRSGRPAREPSSESCSGRSSSPRATATSPRQRCSRTLPPTPAPSRPEPAPCQRGRLEAIEDSARWENLAPPRPRRRLRAPRAARQAADSAESIVCGICTWSGRWRSRSCTPR